MKYRHLPQRFWVASDYEEGDTRFSQFPSLKGAAFKKIYNKTINPYLKKRGYKTNGFTALKTTEQFHLQVCFNLGRYDGEGKLCFVAHPKGFPSKNNRAFEPNSSPETYVMQQVLALPNGQTCIYWGKTEAEGQETAQYLLELLEEALEGLENRYEQAWATDIHALTIDQLEGTYGAFRQNYGLGNSLATDEIATAAHVARFYRLQGDWAAAQAWTDHAHARTTAWATAQDEAQTRQVQLLLDNIVDPDSPLHWTPANFEALNSSITQFRHLPKRFWVDSDYHEGEEKLQKSYFSLKSADFKKIYNKAINPYLKKKGYKASGFKALKETETFFFQVFFGSGKYGGEGVFSLLVHPKGFPTKDDYEFTDAEPPHYYLMCYDFTLPNGCKWIRWGSDAIEGQETAQYLLDMLERALETTEARYLQEWEADARAMTLDQLKAKHEAFRQKYGLRDYLANYEIATAAHLARFHRLDGNLAQAQQWVTHARALEVEWAASQGQSPHLRVKLLLDNVVDPDSPIYWTEANSKVFWGRE